MSTTTKELLDQCREAIELMEYKRDLLKYELTRKTLYLEQCKDDDLPPSQRLVLPGDVIDLTIKPLTELEWVGTSGLKITLITGLEELRDVELVSFRSGFIRQPTGLGHFASSLRVLELYENRLRTLDGVEMLINLEVLDVSYNRLGKLDPKVLAPLTKLVKFYCAENKLTEIPLNVFTHMTQLQVLDLGGNLLRVLQGVDHLPSLKELWLGKNKMDRIDNLVALPNLLRLSLQSNRITRMENLHHLDKLQELYLSDQGIVEIQGISTLVELNTLDLTNNRITSLMNFPSQLINMTDLWLAANQIESFDQVEYLAKHCPLPKLDTLVFERNPKVESEPQYRSKVKLLFPQLTYIDANPC